MQVNVKVEEVSPVKKKLTFAVPWEIVKKELDSAYNKIGRQAKVKGFRPGKTPRKVLETYYKDQAEGEAISSVINNHYWDAIEKNGIMPTSQPTIDQSGIKLEAEFVFSATVETKPAIEPADYVGIEVEKEDAVVSDEAVNARIDELRNMYSTLEDIPEERPIATGDFVSIDFQGSVDGKALDSMKADNYLLEIGSGQFIPGFETELVGLKKGDTKEFNIKFPEDYRSKDVAGKEATFKVEVKALKIKRMPEWNDEFLKNFEKFDSLDALKENIRGAMEEEKKALVESNFQRNIIDKLLEKNVFEVPPTLVDRQIYMMMINYQQQLSRNGIEPQKAAELSYRMRDSMKPEAEKQVKATLLLEAIAKKESIVAEEQDVHDRLAALAARYARDVESIRSSYEKDDLMESLKSEIVEQKALDFIGSKAKITTVTV